MKDTERYGSSFAEGYGHYLYNALRILNISWKYLHMSNAYDIDGELRDLRKKWKKLLMPPRIVALGDVAADALKQYGLPYEQVEHPQFASRFRKDRVFDYASELRNAMHIGR